VLRLSETFAIKVKCTLNKLQRMWVYNDYFIASYLYMYGVHVKISISIKKIFFIIFGQSVCV